MYRINDGGCFPEELFKKITMEKVDENERCRVRSIYVDRVFGTVWIIYKDFTERIIGPRCCGTFDLFCNKCKKVAVYVFENGNVRLEEAGIWETSTNCKSGRGIPCSSTSRFYREDRFSWAIDGIKGIKNFINKGYTVVFHIKSGDKELYLFRVLSESVDVAYDEALKLSRKLDVS